MKKHVLNILNHKNIFFLSVLFFFGNAQTFSQGSGEIPFYDLIGTIKEVKRSCISIEKCKITEDLNVKQPSLLGSGFIAKKSNKIYAITNYHVIKNLKKDDRLLIGVNFKKTKEYNNVVLIDTNSIKDIAILSLRDTIEFKKPLSHSEAIWDQALIGTSLFADSSDFDEGLGVLIIGFPLGLGSEISRNKPISRLGIIAQSLRKDGTFLIDGTVSHGNSGSPVFSARNNKFLGMVVSFPTDHILAYDEEGRLIVSLPYNSGISTCISSIEILKLIP